MIGFRAAFIPGNLKPIEQHTTAELWFAIVAPTAFMSIFVALLILGPPTGNRIAPGVASCAAGRHLSSSVSCIVGHDVVVEAGGCKQRPVTPSPRHRYP